RAEDHSRGADAKRQREYCGQRETRILQEISYGVADVANENVETDFPSRLAHFFLHALHAAKFDQGTPARLLRRHSAGYVAGNLLVEMEAEFLVQVFFGAGVSK